MVVVRCLIGPLSAMQFDVSEQEGNKGTPSENGIMHLIVVGSLLNAAPATTPGLSPTTAMPWLTENSSPPQARETPAPERKQTDEPDQPVRSNPELSEQVTTTNDELPHPEQPLPLLIPEESLENAWLRVSITPESTRADSIPMDQAKPSSRLKRLWQGLNRS